jgi:CRP/FNR family nitrogen fixation transcriptional regulator
MQLQAPLMTDTAPPSDLAMPMAAGFGPFAIAGIIATEFSYGKDEEIYGEEEHAEYVYQVITGAVRSYKLLNDGRRQIHAFYLPGDIFGVESGGARHRMTAEAVVDTGVRLVKRRSLMTVAGKNMEVARRLLGLMSDDLRHAENHMLLLGRKTALERVAAFLLEMDRRLCRAQAQALPMTRRDIGDYLGLTLETVSRSLSQLSGDGVVEVTSARQIAIRDRRRLSDLDG